MSAGKHHLPKLKAPLAGVAAAAVLASLLAGCAQEAPAVNLGVLANRDQEPTLLFEGFRMSALRGKDLEWEFTARAAQVFERESMAKAQDIEVFYWRDGRKVSTLTARRGFIHTGTHDLRAEDHVVMVTEEGNVLRTEKLQWDQARGRIFTDQPVVLERGDNILTGVGLEADEELKQVDILDDVNIRVRSLDDLKPPAGKPGNRP